MGLWALWKGRIVPCIQLTPVASFQDANSPRAPPAPGPRPTCPCLSPWDPEPRDPTFSGLALSRCRQTEVVLQDTSCLVAENFSTARPPLLPVGGHEGCSCERGVSSQGMLTCYTGTPLHCGYPHHQAQGGADHRPAPSGAPCPGLLLALVIQPQWPGLLAER